MKNVTKQIKNIALSLLLSASFAYAGSSYIGYQGVAFNNGIAEASGTISLRFTIYKSDGTTVAYQETVAGVSTSAQGFFSHDVGSGTRVAGATTYAELNWDNDFKLKTEIDLANGTSYTDLGTKDLVSVAYAKNGVNRTNATATGANANAFGDSTIASATASMATGKLSQATAVYATAMGYNTLASGQRSFAAGYQTQATNYNSVAMGGSSKASGSSGIALGLSVTTSGDYSAAMGRSATASGDNSIALGYGATASALTSVAIGQDTIASGEYSMVFGRYSEASGATSLAMGYYTVASAAVTSALGRYTVADQTDMTALGRYNTTGNSGALFVVGNGTSTSARNNAFEVFANGSAYVSNTVLVSSDERLKKDIFTIQNPLDKISNLRGVYYNWKDSSKDQTQQIGLIAQEVQKEFPQAVKEKNDGYLSVNYSGLVGPLVGAIAELKKQNDDLKEKNKKLQEKLNKILLALKKANIIVK